MIRNFLLLTMVMFMSANANAEPHKTESVVLAGGCFWGVQAVFQHTKGVVSATSGYAGGQAQTAHYDVVSGGDTGHAESVKVVYDQQQNPTELNYQGPDHGTQYRSAVFYNSPEQKQAVQAKIATLKQFSDPVVTKLEPLTTFYPAEDYHQNYATLHPYNPYIMMNDSPKISNLQKTFPELYVK